MIEIYRIKSCLQDYAYTSKGDWEEFAELERLAEIGRATEKAYKETYTVNLNINYSKNNFKTIDQIVKFVYNKIIKSRFFLSDNS